MKWKVVPPSISIDWEREALELVRSGLVEEAVAADQANDRVVAADSKPAATPALLQALPPRLGPERVAWLADRARLRFRPTA